MENENNITPIPFMLLSLYFIHHLLNNKSYTDNVTSENDTKPGIISNLDKIRNNVIILKSQINNIIREAENSNNNNVAASSNSNNVVAFIFGLIFVLCFITISITLISTSKKNERIICFLTTLAIIGAVSLIIFSLSFFS